MCFHKETKLQKSLMISFVFRVDGTVPPGTLPGGESYPHPDSIHLPVKLALISDM